MTKPNKLLQKMRIRI